MPIGPGDHGFTLSIGPKGTHSRPHAGQAAVHEPQAHGRPSVKRVAQDEELQGKAAIVALRVREFGFPDANQRFEMPRITLTLVPLDIEPLKKR